jgi:hypothetical protein
LARAHGLAGDVDTAAGYSMQASEVAERIADQADRELVHSDLATLATANNR